MPQSERCVSVSIRVTRLPLRQVFTWSSMSPSEKPAVVPLLPFTLGSIRVLLLFFMVAAQKVTKTNKVKSEGCFQQKNRQDLYWSDGSLGGTRALQWILFHFAFFSFDPPSGWLGNITKKRESLVNSDTVRKSIKTSKQKKDNNHRWSFTIHTSTSG